MVTQSGEIRVPMRQVFPYATVFKLWQMIYANQNDKTQTDRWERSFNLRGRNCLGFSFRIMAKLGKGTP